ncbi:long-chain fatty acid--CoA ligase [Tundrisphaera sp. TA3]|uniref:long-chain fatty acid--CoA ligase n=1 Tax=Tundrisphaera sp. TA3 TaxID=3435775 RepID=UPI003EBB301C
MNGLMMDVPLILPGILDRAARIFPDKEVVARESGGGLRRTTYGAIAPRVARLANALRGLGIRPGDRVATFAQNHDRHLELYFAIPAVSAVLHTVNIRLAREQIRYIINHARDRVLFVDASLAHIVADLAGEFPTVEHVVVIGDGGEAPSLPGPAIDYEDLLASASEASQADRPGEAMAAGLCYTSGTTGEPKGVLYSHRSLYLHAMGTCMVDSFAVGEREAVLPVVPMFHVNAWCLPFACAMAGAKQVYAGAHALGRPLAELIAAERVTFAAGVPTVWNLLHQHLRRHPGEHDVSSLKTVIAAGSAVPRSMIEAYERDLGVTMIQAWGMTELSPIGTVARPTPAMAGDPEAAMAARARQGRPVPGVEVRILDDAGGDLPWDGLHAGELAVRGPWVARAYYEDPGDGAAFTADGWFRTGDVATIDARGYVQVTDRSKDLIKSKGEWISSIEMENAALGLAGVLEAAVVARPDPGRDEAPVLFVVRDPNSPDRPEAADLLRHLADRFARWQLPRPADVRFVAGLPRTSVGKLDKKLLRRTLAEAIPPPHFGRAGAARTGETASGSVESG